MSLQQVYHARRAERKPLAGANTHLIAVLATTGLSHGAILVKLILEEHGGFVPKEQLADLLRCSERQILRYLSEIKRFREQGREAAPTLPDATAAAEVAAAGLNETTTSHLTDRLQQEVPTQEPRNVTSLGIVQNNNQQTVRSSVPINPQLAAEIEQITREWYAPTLPQVLPSRLQTAIEATGGYIAGTLTEAWRVANGAWQRLHCRNRIGYLIGVFRNMLPEVHASLQALRERLYMVKIIGENGGLDVLAAVQQELEHFEELGGAQAVAARTLRLELGL